MMTVTYILAALVLLGLCIFIHELGHLLGGKMVGIKAKIFSMGYGKGVVKRTWGETTYQITLIPLGGYCQFYGEEPGEDREGHDYEFLSAAPWRRIVVVAMGPLFNLFFGIALFFIMNMAGYSTETNRIYIPAELSSGKNISAAYQAGMRSGDRILSINGNTVRSFSDIQSNVIFSDGIQLGIEVERDGGTKKFTVVPKNMQSGGRYSIGVAPYGTNIMLAGVVDGDVADSAGLEKLDEIVSVDGRKMHDAGEFTSYIKQKEGKTVSLKIIRAGKDMHISLVPRASISLSFDSGASIDMSLIKKYLAKKKLTLNGKVFTSEEDFVSEVEKNRGKVLALESDEGRISGKAFFEKRGFIGVYPVLSPEMIELEYGFADGLVRSFTEPWEFIVLNIKGMGMLFSGKMSVRENLSGPIRIAKIAGDVAYFKGFSAFVILMAKISIILMVMNFLPIPVVDGGHLVFFTIEAIRGKPISENVMARIQTAGVIFLIMLGVFVIINDISMLPFVRKFFNL